jgi:hypothetical protein
MNSFMESDKRLLTSNLGFAGRRAARFGARHGSETSPRHYPAATARLS